MTAQGRVADFLKEEHTPYCDDCIAQLLHLNRTTVYMAARSLENTADFKRHIGVCASCGKTTKFVTRAV